MIDIKGYEGHYAITREGKVWSYISNRFLKPFKSGKGYLSVDLKTVDGSPSKTLTVHRITLSSFCTPLNLKYEINHIDGDKTNNDLSNLEWCTGSENAIHAFKCKLRCNKGDSHPGAKLSSEDVINIRSSTAKGITLAGKYNVSSTTISDIRRYKIWKHV